MTLLFGPMAILSTCVGNQVMLFKIWTAANVIGAGVAQPGIVIAILVAQLIALHRMRKESNITCLIPHKTAVVGCVDAVVLDKTGVITEGQQRIVGVQPNGKTLEGCQVIEWDAEIWNRWEREVPVEMQEILGCCHNVGLISNREGNPEGAENASAHDPSVPRKTISLEHTPMGDDSTFWETFPNKARVAGQSLEVSMFERSGWSLQMSLDGRSGRFLIPPKPEKRGTFLPRSRMS